MEEVDSIIIHQLQEIGCSFEDDYQSLKEFSFHDTILCIAKIITQINPDIGSSINIAPNLNMASKYKLASQLCYICSELGFKDDLGYQTFLYCNESDIRKVIIFLLEKIHKDEIRSSVVTVETPFDKLTKFPISTTWLPPMTSRDPDKNCKCFWNTIPLNLMFDVNIIKDRKKSSFIHQYYDKYANFPIDIGTLIEWNATMLNPIHKKHSLIIEKKDSTVHKKSNLTNNHKETEYNTCNVESTNTLNTASENLQSRVNELQNTLDEKVAELKQLQEKASSQEKSISEIEVELEKSKQSWLGSKKSTLDLRNEISNLKEEIISLKYKLSSIQEQAERIEQEKDQQEKAKAEITKKENVLKDIKYSISTATKEIEIKDSAILSLYKDLDQKTVLPNRAFYTNGIIDIVNNVKKQNQEIKKISSETRELRREITSLTDKVQRAYAITDELIFQEAKTSEWNRKCYKLLATLRESYESLLDYIDSIGMMRRDILQMEEKVENEKQSKVSSNLTRIKADLNTVSEENNALITKLNKGAINHS